MTRSAAALLILVASMVVGCADDFAPPAYENVNNISVAGHGGMTARQYHDTFCKNQPPETNSHVRCQAALAKANTDSSNKTLGLDAKKAALERLEKGN